MEKNQKFDNKLNRIKRVESLKLMSRSSVFKLALLMLIIIVPICILTLVMSGKAIRMAERQVSDDIQEALNLNMNQVDNYLQNIGRRLYTVSRGNDDYIRLMMGNNSSEQAEEDGIELMHAYTRLGSVLADIQSEYTWADFVFAYFPASGYFLSSKTYQVQENQNMLISEIEKGERDGSSWYIVSDIDPLLVGIFRYRNSWYGAGLKLDTLLTNISLSSSENIEAFANKVTGEVQGDRKDINIFKGEEASFLIDEKRYIMQYSASEISELALVDFISREQMDRTLPGFMRILLLISIIFLLCIPVLFFCFWKWLVKPVNVLIEAIDYVDSGNLNYRINEKTGTFEFDLLNRNFNEMLDSVQNLKIDVYEKELEKQDIRLNYLSQQIQPHFILNAMNIIYSYEPEEYELIQRMVLCLSRYFQFIVNANSSSVKIKHEMEHIRNYLEIQKIRYGENRIRFEVLAEDDVKDALMPPLMLQNLVENIIKYALRDDKPVDILVNARAEGDKVSIIVRDTGFGMPDDILESIKRFKETRVRQENLGVGIQNTIERMALFFGEDSSFEARRWMEGEGTEVNLTFRKILEDL